MQKKLISLFLVQMTGGFVKEIMLLYLGILIFMDKKKL